MPFRILYLSAALLVAACSSPAPQSHQVASLASAGPSPSSSAVTSGRPQLRLDTSDAESARLFSVYDDCLIAHGVKVLTGREGSVAAAASVDGHRALDQSGEPKAAYVACATKLPLQPPELDQDKNPNYAAQWNDNVKCLRANGLMVHVTEPGSWTYDSSDTVVPDNEAELEKSCLLEAFGGTHDTTK
jgi:hypothetical protein